MAEPDLERSSHDAPVYLGAEGAAGWASGWNAAVEHLRSLPVEQRMEAMGMVPDFILRGVTNDQRRCWVDAAEERDEFGNWPS